ncbi:hypothetical protein BH20ACI3_BH20ACI3_03840 [soil metagenome]
MGQKRLLLATLLVTLLGSITLAQTGQKVALDAIRRGNQKYAKAQYELAIEEYRRVPPSAGDTYAQSLYNIGVCYYELWSTEEATAYYRRAVLARKGRYPMALYALGVALIDSKRPLEAKEAFRQSITAADGKHATAHFMLGLLLIGEGGDEAAAASFKETIALSKDRFPGSHNNLGVAEAKREFEIALRPCCTLRAMMYSVFGPGVKTRIEAAVANMIKVDHSGISLHFSV